MAVYLVQHGVAEPKEIDPQRRLSAAGINETERIAAVAKRYKVHLTAIVHSPKKRAKQTAELFAQALQPEQGVSEIAGIKPLDDVVIFSKQLDHSKDIMYIGHLPFMDRLTSLLATGTSDKTIFKFQNSGIVCLDQDHNSGWFIKWALMPLIS